MASNEFFHDGESLVGWMSNSVFIGQKACEFDKRQCSYNEEKPPSLADRSVLQGKEPANNRTRNAVCGKIKPVSMINTAAFNKKENL